MTRVPYLTMSLMLKILMTSKIGLKTSMIIVMVTRTVITEGQVGLLLGPSVALSCSSKPLISLLWQSAASGGIQDSSEPLSTLSVHVVATLAQSLCSLSLDLGRLENCAPSTELLILMMEISTHPMILVLEKLRSLATTTSATAIEDCNMRATSIGPFSVDPTSTVTSMTQDTSKLVL